MTTKASDNIGAALTASSGHILRITLLRIKGRAGALNGASSPLDSSLVARLLALALAGAAIGLEDLLAQAEGLRGHLDEFVVGDELDALL